MLRLNLRGIGGLASLDGGMTLLAACGEVVSFFDVRKLPVDDVKERGAALSFERVSAGDGARLISLCASDGWVCAGGSRGEVWFWDL